MQKLQKYKPRIAAFNGKCENLGFPMNLFCQQLFSPLPHLSYILFISGIYEIFSKEVFGIKVKNLEFGLQPHKVPDTETVSIDAEEQNQGFHFGYLKTSSVSGLAYTQDNIKVCPKYMGKT